MINFVSFFTAVRLKFGKRNILVQLIMSDLYISCTKWKVCVFSYQVYTTFFIYGLIFTTTNKLHYPYLHSYF